MAHVAAGIVVMVLSPWVAVPWLLQPVLSVAVVLSVGSPPVGGPPPQIRRLAIYHGVIVVEVPSPWGSLESPVVLSSSVAIAGWAAEKYLAQVDSRLLQPKLRGPEPPHRTPEGQLAVQ